MTKTCKNCQESKPLDGFTTDGRTRDGLRKVCEDCRTARSAVQRPVPALWEPETMAQQNGAHTATESRKQALADYENTFADMVKDLETPKALDVPWPLEDFDSLTEEQLDASDGILIALLRGDAMGSKFLMSQVCTTWKDVTGVLSFITSVMIQSLQDGGDSECLIRAVENIIHERETA